jgi:hypothetical protein
MISFGGVHDVEGSNAIVLASNLIFIFDNQEFTDVLRTQWFAAAMRRRSGCITPIPSHSHLEALLDAMLRGVV